MTSWSDHVLPHGPLVQLAPRVWQVTGSLKGMGLPRNMTVWRMDSGGLWIHSAVALDDARMAELEALGRPEVLVVPNGYHRADPGVWKERYPDIRVVCPEASRARVEQVVKVDGLDTEVLGAVAHAPPGIKETEHIYEIDAGAGRALVVCDALFNLDAMPGFAGFMLEMMGSSGFFGMTRIARFLLLRDAKAWRGWLERTAEEPDIALVCVSHGQPVMADTALKLRAAAARL